MDVFDEPPIRAGIEKYHILELGAGDFSKSLKLAGYLATGFDSQSVYDAFDYTATELADIPEKREDHQHHLVESGLITTNRNRNRLESIMHFMGGVDGTRLDQVQPAIKSDLIVWQAPHTGIHGNSRINLSDPRIRLVETGQKFYEHNRKDLNYPADSPRGPLANLQNEAMSNVGLMVGFFNTAHNKISRQLDENNQAHTGKIALVVLNSIPFKWGGTYMPILVAEQSGWQLSEAGHIEEYFLERTTTGEKIASRTGASLLIFEESPAYLQQCTKRSIQP